MTRRKTYAPPPHRPGCLTDIVSKYHDNARQSCRLACGCEIPHGGARAAICMKEQHKCRAIRA